MDDREHRDRAGEPRGEADPTEEARSASWPAVAVIFVAMLLIGVVEWWLQRP